MRARLALVALVAGLPVSGWADAPVDASWSGTRAMDDIAAQLSFSPRSIGTPGHDKEIEYISSEMAKAYPEPVRLQRWDYHSEDGQVFHMANIVARLYPQATRRIILGTHYDSIIRAYRDPKNPTGIMPGANNSASGVAVLLETARALKTLPPPAVGIDFVFFDGEEGPRALGAGDPHWRAIGSPYFTEHLADFYPGAKPVAAAIFDMVGYRDLV
ncbi:MAG TPA: M28 family peptidase, partial [Stellaceae bacterium]|nr:M28 family peptidase [Stellaceae bacterium]